MPDRPLLPARAAVGLVVLVGLALPLAATVHAGLSGPRPHGATVAIVGPTVVAQAAAARANALPGHPLDARVVDVGDELVPSDGRSVRDELRRGRAVAAVVIDLRRTSDAFLVADWLTDDAAARLRDTAATVSGSYGRTLHTERVAPAHPVSGALPGRLVALLVAIGVALAAALSAWRGPVAATTARGLARLAGTLAAGLVVGLVVGASVDAEQPGFVGLVAATTITVSAWLVLAAESVLGLAGLGLATGLLLGPVLPLLGGADPAYLPSPWWQLEEAGVQQAALRLVQHHAMGIDVARLRSWTVLGAWASVALLTLVVSRVERPATHTRAGRSRP